MTQSRRSASPAARGRRGRAFVWISVGVSAFLIGSALFGRDGWLSVVVNRQRLARLGEEIEGLRRENRRLRGDIRSLRTDLRAIERIAREDLGLVKPGETVYEFLPGAAGGKAPREGPSPPLRLDRKPPKD